MDIGAAYYDKVFTESKDFNVNYRYSKHNAMWSKAIEWIAIGESVCEIGCGTGQFAEMLNDAGKHNEYIGYDYSTVAIDKAYQRCPHLTFINCDIFTIPDFLGDVVVAMEVLEHLDDDLGILDRIQPGTSVIFSVPDFGDPSHVRKFNDVKAVLERYGNTISIQEVHAYGNDKKWYLCIGIKK